MSNSTNDLSPASTTSYPYQHYFYSKKTDVSIEKALAGVDILPNEGFELKSENGTFIADVKNKLQSSYSDFAQKLEKAPSEAIRLTSQDVTDLKDSLSPEHKGFLYGSLRRLDIDHSKVERILKEKVLPQNPAEEQKQPPLAEEKTHSGTDFIEAYFQKYQTDVGRHEQIIVSIDGKPVLSYSGKIPNAEFGNLFLSLALEEKLPLSLPFISTCQEAIWTNPELCPLNALIQSREAPNSSSGETVATFLAEKKPASKQQKFEDSIWVDYQSEEKKATITKIKTVHYFSNPGEEFKEKSKSIHTFEFKGEDKNIPSKITQAHEVWMGFASEENSQKFASFFEPKMEENGRSFQHKTEQQYSRLTLIAAAITVAALASGFLVPLMIFTIAIAGIFTVLLGGIAARHQKNKAFHETSSALKRPEGMKTPILSKTPPRKEIDQPKQRKVLPEELTAT